MIVNFVVNEFAFTKNDNDNNVKAVKLTVRSVTLRLFFKKENSSAAVFVVSYLLGLDLNFYDFSL